MSAVILYITDKGRTLAEKLRVFYPDARIGRFSTEKVAASWTETRTFIFIMAAGIAVRTIAPLLADKRTDPAVVVLDEAGKFAVSLLSGHLGGANERAREIAGFLGGKAVITTASDVNTLPPLDLWARDNNLVIEDWDLLPHLGTRFLDNGALRVYADVDMELPDEFLRVGEPRFADLLITARLDAYKEQCMPGMNCGPDSCRVKGQLYLRPKNLFVGIGCNKGTPEEEIQEMVQETLRTNNLAFSSIHCLATITLKASEEGLLAFAQKYTLDIQAFSPEMLNSVQGIARSEAVFRATGANAVAGPAALMAAGASGLPARLLVQKQKKGNVTVAVAWYDTLNKKEDCV